MVAKAILTFKMKENAHFGPPDFKILPCGAHNGYVTVKKRSVFVFCLGGPGAPDPGGGGALNER